jgi:hypothetical protein
MAYLLNSTFRLLGYLCLKWISSIPHIIEPGVLSHLTSAGRLRFFDGSNEFNIIINIVGFEPTNLVILISNFPFVFHSSFLPFL